MRRLRALHQAGQDRLTAWELDFLGPGADGVPGRIETYGKAWAEPSLADPSALDSPLSARQRTKVEEIARAVRRRKPQRSPPGTRDVDDAP